MQSAEISWFLLSFPPSVIEGIVPASLRLSYLCSQKTCCWSVSGHLWGLLFNPLHLNESGLGLGSLASLKWCYLSCALSDWDAVQRCCAPVCSGEPVRRMQGTVCCEQAGGLVQLEGSDTDPHLREGEQRACGWGISNRKACPLPLCQWGGGNLNKKLFVYAYLYTVSFSLRFSHICCRAWNIGLRHIALLKCLALESYFFRCCCPPSKLVAFLWCFMLLTVLHVTVAIK